MASRPLPNPVRILDCDTYMPQARSLSSVRNFPSEFANFPPKSLRSISYGTAAFSAVFLANKQYSSDFFETSSPGFLRISVNLYCRPSDGLRVLSKGTA